MGYGALVFIVSLLTQLFDMDLQTAGATFGSIALFGAIFGNLLGGFLANALARKNLANLPRTAGWAVILWVPVFEFALSRSTMTAMYLDRQSTRLNYSTECASRMPYSAR